MIVTAPTLPVTPQVTAFVYELFAYHLSEARAETSATRSLPSTALPAIFAAELGCVGSGNDGTKPVIGIVNDPELRQRIERDPLGHRRYQSLTGRDRLTADAVHFDGKGVVIADVTFDKRVISCTLAQRVAFQVAETMDAKRYCRWLGKIAAKDSAPALIDSEAFGSECLTSAAKAWFAISA